MSSRCDKCEHGISWQFGDEGYWAWSCELLGQSHHYPEICPEDKKPTEIKEE